MKFLTAVLFSVLVFSVLTNMSQWKKTEKLQSQIEQSKFLEAWHHWTVSYGPDSTRTYLDGQLVSEVAYGPSQPATMAIWIRISADSYVHTSGPYLSFSKESDHKILEIYSGRFKESINE